MDLEESERLAGLLPTLLSEACRVAVQDLCLCEKDPNYLICMVTWHYPSRYRPEDDVRCEVCLAGSVLAKTCRVSPQEEYVPGYGGDAVRSAIISGRLREQLFAINLVRTGALYGAVNLWYGKDGNHAPYRTPVAAYGRNPPLFKQQILAIADLLERMGY